MPSSTVESLLSTLVGVGTHKLFQALGLDGKGFRILALLIGLIVFCNLPFMFDDEKNTGSKEADDFVENFSDGFSVVLRAYASVVVFIVFAIVISTS